MTEQIAGFDVEHLHGPEHIPYSKNELVVLCLVQNGLPWVRAFVEHYFSLGVKHIIFLDNDSRDSTVSAASEYNGVTVLQTELPFSAVIEGIKGETLMRRYLIERFGKGRWSLCVDIDELFDYPYSDVVGLNSFLGYLNSKSYTAVIAHMLDMFPEKLSVNSTQETVKELKDEYRFYDISSVDTAREKKDKLLATTNNLIESDEVAVKLKGGIRTDVFGVKSHTLRKYPLIFSDGTLEHRGAHKVYNARVADFTGVLFHYKFYAFSLQDYRYRAIEHKKEGRRKMKRKYTQYLEILDKNPELRPKRETSRELSSVNDLLENGFLVASEDYLSWVNAEEGRLSLAPSQSEPRALVEALLESERQERAKTLRLGRLERRLGDRDAKVQALEKQLQERRQELESSQRREQALSKKIDRLQTRLQSSRRKEQGLSRKLGRREQHLEDVRNSRVWKLGQNLRHIKLRLQGLRGSSR